MKGLELSRGGGKTRVRLSAYELGSDLVMCIHNENAHIGAVAVSEYDNKEQRVSTSVITRLGHKDDAIAQKAAYSVAKYTRKPVCVIAGIHIDDITREQIKQVVENVDALIEDFLSKSDA